MHTPDGCLGPQAAGVMESTPLHPTLTVSRLAFFEIILLERHLAFGPPDKHRERYALQMKDEVAYLIAWHGGLPVGHVLLRWQGTNDEPVASTLCNCPCVEDLFAAPDFRSLGTGSQLLAAAETAARQRGYGMIGLGVGVDNTRARSLYERTGYTQTIFKPYPHETFYVDAHGLVRSRTEICVYLIKAL